MLKVTSLPRGRKILSQEQIDYMMDMMYTDLSLSQQMTSGKNVFFLIDGKGYASYRFKGRGEDSVDVFHIEKLYVMPDAQGNGLGRELFETVVSDAKMSAVGPVRIELNVNRHNAKAIAFYEHMGMHRKEQGDFPIGSGFFMNDYIMSLTYSPA